MAGCAKTIPSRCPGDMASDKTGCVLLQGRLTLLLGPPGAGKSTLLKALSGKLRKDSSLQVSTLACHSIT